MRCNVEVLEMFELGYLEKAMSKPTTTKWVDVVKTDEGLEFVRCRLVARDIKLRREGPRDDLFAAMPPFEAKNALSAQVAGVRE